MDTEPELSAEYVRRIVARTIYRLAHRIDRIGWWVAETPGDRRIRRESKAAALALRCENCGKTMAEHDEMAHCWGPGSKTFTTEGA